MCHVYSIVILNLRPLSCCLMFAKQSPACCDVSTKATNSILYDVVVYEYWRVCSFCEVEYRHWLGVVDIHHISDFTLRFDVL